MNYKELVVGFFIGLGTEFIAEYLIRRFKALNNKKDLSELEGYWVEIISGQEDRKISIAKFDFNSFKLEYQLDGTNYKYDGNPVYEWITEETIFKPESKKLLFFYTVIENGNNHSEKHGFGLIRLDKPKNIYSMKTGYFLDAGDEKNPKHMKLIRGEDVANKINFKVDFSDKDNVAEFVRQINKNIDRFQ